MLLLGVDAQVLRGLHGFGVFEHRLVGVSPHVDECLEKLAAISRRARDGVSSAALRESKPQADEHRQGLQRESGVRLAALRQAPDGEDRLATVTAFSAGPTT